MPDITIDPNSDLVVHVLNIGFGDTSVVELPADAAGDRRLGIVDCCDADKTIDYVRQIRELRPRTRVAFICATHPHDDHVSGIKELLLNDLTRPEEFWDSGFRHSSVGYGKILKAISDNKLKMIRVSSGMEWYFGRVRITALSPSVSLRNRYSTYGVDMNNASVVLRLEHCADDVVNIQSLRYNALDDPDFVRTTQETRAVAILGGDAEFDSWAYISQEYPYQEQDSGKLAVLREKKLVNLLACNMLKVSHHGSMHSIPLAVFEQMGPNLAVISTGPWKGAKAPKAENPERTLFPHAITKEALKEVKARILTTDGSFTTEPDLAREGTVVVVLRSGAKMRYQKLTDKAGEKAKVI